MESQEQDHLRRLLDAHRRRLRLLEEQQALQGIDTRPGIVIEIEDLRKTIERIQAQVDSFPGIVNTDPGARLSQSPNVSTIGREQIEITFDGDFDGFTLEKQNAVVLVLASVAGISPDQIRVLKVMKGSVIFIIELPIDASDTLQELYESGAEVLKELGIQEIRVISEKVLAVSQLGENAVVAESTLLQLGVEELVQKCAQETNLYFAHQGYDSRYCFELFRRAIRDNDERAFEALIIQYQPLVARWVDRWIDKHPGFSLFNEETQDIVAKAFERFWRGFTPAKLEISQNLAAVLKYLQMCVNGALTDSWRQSHSFKLAQEAGDEEHEVSEPEPTPEDLLQQDEFWQLIEKKTKDAKEYKVVYASFFLELSPREILAEYHDEFGSIKEIYQHKSNFLERLGRSGQDEDREIRTYFINKKDAPDT